MIETITPLSAFDDASLDMAFRALSDEVRAAAPQLKSAEAQENFRLEWLGRKQGRLKLLSETWLKTAPPEAKKSLGMRFNTLKQEIEAALSGEASAKSTAAPSLDLSLPGIRRSIGVGASADAHHARDDRGLRRAWLLGRRGSGG